jgi:hypothetical protein
LRERTPPSLFTILHLTSKETFEELLAISSFSDKLHAGIFTGVLMHVGVVMVVVVVMLVGVVMVVVVVMLVGVVMVVVVVVMRLTGTVNSIVFDSVSIDFVFDSVSIDFVFDSVSFEDFKISVLYTSYHFSKYKKDNRTNVENIKIDNRYSYSLTYLQRRLSSITFV